MDERMTRIVNYEKRLLQDRMQLQLLTEEYGVSDTKMLKSKIQYFQREIAYMEEQLEFLQEQIKSEDPPVYSVQSETERIKIDEAKPEIKGEPQSEKFTEKTKDLENTIGKSLMGIFASVLIFISFILFATVLLPYFNDTAKMVSMYLVSFGFLGLGIAKMQKESENKFYIALTGCGIGAVYISLLVSNMYFKAIGDIVLYVLIALWAAGVCVIAKIKNEIFQIIGQLGVLIAVIFGAIICSNDNDLAMFTALIIFYIVSSGVFYFVQYEKSFERNYINHLFNAANFCVLYFSYYDVVNDKLCPQGFLLLLLFAAYIGLLLFYENISKAGDAFGIVVAGYSFCLIGGMEWFGLSDEWLEVVRFLICALLVVAVERREFDKPIGKYIAQGMLLLYLQRSIDTSRELTIYGMVPVLILPLTYFGFSRKNTVFKYAGLGILWIYQNVFRYTSYPLHLALGILAIGVILYLIYKNKEQCSVAYKYIFHVLALLLLCKDTYKMYEIVDNWDLVDACVLAVGVLYNIAILKSPIGKNLRDGEMKVGRFYHIINAVGMIAGVCSLDDYEGFYHLAIVIVTIAAFMVNAKNILDKRDNIWGGIYVGVKFTILLVCIMRSFDTPNYLISVSCLIMAILCIVIGFVADYKSLRIFGLALSMLSTFKLIMIDISYDNTLGNAMSFFASGVLCFAISMIYNFIDKKMKKEN